jgi:hypothetical protein
MTEMNRQLSEIELLKYLISHQEFKQYCKDIEGQFPSELSGKLPIRAVVLGTDPDKMKLSQVFALEQGEESPYFLSTFKNLKEVSLKLNEVYVQNLCKNYMTESTAQNKKWLKIAELWIPFLQKELSEFDEEIPILLTACILSDALCYKKVRRGKAGDYHYEHCEFIAPDENKLGRLLIPFYRHPKYSLLDPRWAAYKEKVKRYLERNN